MTKHLRICYLCAANDISEAYSKPAVTLVRLASEAGYEFVWGGSDNGLMALLANTAKAYGAKIIGVSVEYLRHKAKPNADEMIIAKDLTDRKSIMLQKADVFVGVVGGIGTIDEITAMLELKKHGLHDKPIIVMNSNGFFNGFRDQLLRMEHDGFLKATLDSYITFVETPAAVMALLSKISL